MSKAAGFTLIELIAVMIVLAIIGIFAAPQMLDLRSDAGNAMAGEYAAQVATASKTNYSKGMSRGTGSVVTTCAEAVALAGALPGRLTLTDVTGVAAVASAQEKECRLTDSAPSAAAQTFRITSCINVSCS